MRSKFPIIIITLIMALFAAGVGIASQSQERLGTGLELSLAFKETIASQRAELEDFIFEAKFGGAGKEEQLKMIEERQLSFSLALDEIAMERAELKKALENNTITQEAFTAGMRALGLKVALNSKGLQTVEKALVKLEKALAEKQRQKFAILEEKHRELKKRSGSEGGMEGETALLQIERNETQKMQINESQRRGERYD